MAVPVAHLARAALFQGCDAATLKIFADMARPRDVPHGMSIFLAGVGGDGLLVVASGKVEIIAPKSAGEKLLWVLEAGESFGEMALVRPGPRMVSARALEATQLVEIKRFDFNEALKSAPQACAKLMLNLCLQLELRVRGLQDPLLSLV